MNIVFWLLICVALSLVWYGLRKMFVGIGKSVSDKKDEVTEILHTNVSDEVLNDSHISDEVKEEFAMYYKENIQSWKE